MANDCFLLTVVVLSKKGQIVVGGGVYCYYKQWRWESCSLRALHIMSIIYSPPFTKHCRELCLLQQDLTDLKITSLSFKMNFNFNKHQKIGKTVSQSHNACSKSKHRALLGITHHPLRSRWVDEQT